MKIVLILVLISLLILIIPGLNLTGKIINNSHYKYTKAICDESNYCEDYVIECEGKKEPKLTATGFSIQQDINWEDKRERKEYC